MAGDLAANHALYPLYVHSVRASDLERIWQKTWQQIMHSTPYVHSVRASDLERMAGSANHALYSVRVRAFYDSNRVSDLEPCHLPCKCVIKARKW
jgi:hypothetical protein